MSPCAEGSAEWIFLKASSGMKMKYWKKQLCKLLYKLFCLFPGTSRICFIECGTSRSYSNLDILWEYLHEKVKSVRIDGTTCCLSALWNISRSSVLVMDQSSPMVSNLRIEDKTVCVQVWHSSGLYKYVGFDAIRNHIDVEVEIRRLNRIHGNIDWFIISDKKLINNYAQAFNLNPKQVLPLGLVRTDRLYTCDIAEAHEKLFHMFPECRGKKLLLYAPTFRSGDMQGKRTHRYQLDVALLQAKLGQDWCFLLRRHPSVVEDVPEGWKDVSLLLQEDCLAMSDVLVTDYSSILFDYSFFRRPIFLFISDIIGYKHKERGIYIEPEELVGEKYVCHSSQEIVEKIRYLNNDEHHIWEKYMSACDGHSAERVACFIEKLSKRNVK